MKNKRGFTLIEIIIVITLIIIIGVGSFIGIQLINKKNIINNLEQITEKALLAAEVYIETNKQSYDQLYNNKNGVVMPIQMLINEGLLSLDGTNIIESQITDHYVITYLNNSGENCDEVTSQVSWSNQPIFLCLTSVSNESEKVADLENRIEKLETYLNQKEYVFKGSNPNNYVEFAVNSDSSKLAYFPNDGDKNLWRIYSYTGMDIENNTANLVLTYNKPIISNNVKLFNHTWSELSSTYIEGPDRYYDTKKLENCYCNEPRRTGKLNYIPSSGTYKYYCDRSPFNGSFNLTSSISLDDITPYTYCEPIKQFEGITNDKYIKINSDNGGWTVQDYLDSSSDSSSKKSNLYNSIVNKEWILKDNYNIIYNSANKVYYSKSQEDFIGVLNYDQYSKTIDNSYSYLDVAYNISLGYYRQYPDQFTTYKLISHSGTTINSAVHIEETVSDSYKNINTAQFVPTITLKSNVKISKPTNCSNYGTKDCPYKLEYVE